MLLRRLRLYAHIWGRIEKDEDGSIRVPGYRGVGVNQAGKYFVKIKKKRLQDEAAGDTMYFDNVDEAAKKHDAILKETSSGKNVELNFKEDGSRIVYEDVTTSSTSGLGGSAASVVPALSVINIKVRFLGRHMSVSLFAKENPHSFASSIPFRICLQM